MRPTSSEEKGAKGVGVTNVIPKREAMAPSPQRRGKQNAALLQRKERVQPVVGPAWFWFDLTLRMVMAPEAPNRILNPKGGGSGQWTSPPPHEPFTKLSNLSEGCR
jgi:hypothetical protein